MTSTKSSYRAMAEAQGVLRPFEILERMPMESRLLIGKALRCHLERDDDPEWQAWRILNTNLRGLQARTHHLPEQLTPFYRNNNWWEIVTRTARRCGLRFYPGLKDEEVERLLFEHLAETFVKHHLAKDVEAVDNLAENVPELQQALQSMRLSRNGMRAVLSAMALGTVRGDGNIREGIKKASEWLQKNIGWSWAISISDGLRLLRQRLTDVYRTWESQGFSRSARSNKSKVCAALAMIYFQDLIDRTLEEYETLRA